MTEHGIFHQLVLKTQETDMNFKTIDDGIALTYKNVIFPSLIIAVGIILAGCQTVVENVWHKVNEKFRKT